MNITNFAEAQQALSRYYNVVGSNSYTLERIRALLAYLGNPQDDLRVVHVAGTSGKTSTVYYAAALLEQSGAKVGLTVSPHVRELNERLQINRVPMPEADFCRALTEYMERVERSAVEPSYFELLIAFVYWQFKRQAVDYAVVEVGLGGLLDGTNVISRSDKVCVITDIGFDHTHILGNTLGEIAAQKAGIIQPGNQVYIYDQGAEVLDVVRQRCWQQNAFLNVLPREAQDLTAKFDMALFQKRNFGLAYAAVSHVLERDGRPPLDSRQLQKASEIYIPGRMEIVHLKDKTVVLDGAHNAQKMTALVASLRQKYPSQPIAAVIAVAEAKDKRWQGALQALVPQLRRVVVTSFEIAQDAPKQSVAPAIVADYIRSMADTEIAVRPSVDEALRLLLAGRQPIILVTGSLYIIGAAQTALEAVRTSQ